ncbi:MAG: hypothetical protein WBF51_04050 [Candidatus Dormiibacterota bacterium]
MPTRPAPPTPRDLHQARQYIDGCIAIQLEMGYPVSVPEADLEKAVLEVAKWTAKMRRLAIASTREPSHAH